MESLVNPPREESKLLEVMKEAYSTIKQYQSVENSANIHRTLDTNLSKTNAFFKTNDSGTPRPPPSISRKISIKHRPVILEPEESHHESYASRLRNLVATTRQVAPAPIPSSSVKTISEETAAPHLAGDKIMPILKQNDLDEAKRPEEIPVISCLSTSISSELPRLSDEPTLGDYVENPTRREIQIGQSQTAIHVLDEDIIGKRIGSYKVSQLLGVGAFSKVYIGHHIETNEYCAIKTIQKGKLLNDPRIRSSIEREIGVLKYINHPNIVRLESTMETEQFICIVLEYVEGGELFDFVQKMHYQSRLTRQKVNETMIKKLFLQLVKAVKWLHDHHIVHRDLKLENILIHKEGDQLILKITDFGLARVVDPDSPLLTTRCGSEEYAAPEIVQGKAYDGRKTDVWALGIILYALLVGYLPFRYDMHKQEKVSQLFYRIVKAETKWPTDELSELSSEAKLVVSTLLERSPEKRIHINDIEHLSWFK